jgi:hypothetical protein
MRRIYLALLCACAVVAGCGGGRQETASAADFVQPAARAALTANTPDATHMLDWAELHYPQFFPSHQPDQTGYGYTYRYYAETGNYVGVSGSDVAVLGPISGGAILNVGTLPGFACDVDPAACGRPDVIVQPQSTGAAPGGTALFELAVGPAAPATIQWEVSTDAGHNFTSIPGANSAIFTTTAASSDNGKWFHALVWNAQGMVTTRAAKLTVGAATVVTSCTEISAPGNYVLGADAKATQSTVGGCLHVHDTHDVYLDCAGHSLTQNGHSSDQTTWVSSLLIERVRDFSVRNCALIDDEPSVNESENGSISHITLTNDGSSQLAFAMRTPTRLQFFANIVVGGIYQFGGFQNTVAANTLSWTPGIDGAALMVSGSSRGTLIAGNTMDGSFTGGAWHLAADDGVLLSDETEPIVQDNAIANVYDTGIEWAGLLNAAKIRRNTISHTGYTGIGGWYWASLLNSEIVANDISGVPTMFYLQHTNVLRPIDTGIYFMNNRFEGNMLHATDAGQMSIWARVYDYLGYNFSAVANNPAERAATPADFYLSGNVFINNNFGYTAIGPWFGYGSGTPVPGEIVDGGGNICKRYLGWPAPITCH